MILRKTRYTATRLIINDLTRYKRFLHVFGGIGLESL